MLEEKLLLFTQPKNAPPPTYVVGLDWFLGKVYCEPPSTKTYGKPCVCVDTFNQPGVGEYDGVSSVLK